MIAPDTQAPSRRSVASLILLATLLSLSACGDDETTTPPGGTPPKAGPVRSAVSDGGTWRVEYQPTPDAIPLNALFRMSVKVSAVDGSQVGTDTRMKADAGMPSHGHGMNTLPRSKSVGGGGFEAEGFLFHMPGAWQITVDVMRGEKTERATFDVTVR